MKKPEEVLQQMIGATAFQVAELMAVAQNEAEKTLRAYQNLAVCIRSEQVPPDQVAGILRDDPEFAAWFRAQGGGNA